MKMETVGLIDFWSKQWGGDPSNCLKKNDQLLMNNNKIAAGKNNKKRLTLKGLLLQYVNLGPRAQQVKTWRCSANPPNRVVYLTGERRLNKKEKEYN